MSRSRAIIHVFGPNGAGKTTFVETILRHVDACLFAARCVQDDGVSSPRETQPKSDRELRHYREAAAEGVARFTFRARDIDSGAFFQTHLMEDYSDGVILEGDSPVRYADLAVYVTSAPSRGQRLLVRRATTMSARARGSAQRRLARDPAGLDALLETMFGGALRGALRNDPNLLEEASRVLRAAARSAPRESHERRAERWGIAAPFQGIQHAQLVVVNIRDEAERHNAKRLVADVARLRSDAEVFGDIFDYRGTRVPITTVVANLADGRDRGWRKALARVRRAIRGAETG
jgi:hypothetical protein